MKKFFDIVMPVKTAACYIFTATMCVYAVLDLVFGWGGLPDNYLFSFLLLSLAGGVLQIVAFTELVIKRLRYTLRLFVFAVPYLAVLSAIAAGFGWPSMTDASDKLGQHYVFECESVEVDLYEDGR